MLAAVIRRALTKTVVKQVRGGKKLERVELPPSERLVYGLYFAFLALTMLTALKMVMEHHRLKMPYNRRLCQQLNEQQYAYNKAGYLTFSHPEESHDDMICALALANQATRHKQAKPFFTAIQK
jgi:hypothetical protein